MSQLEAWIVTALGMGVVFAGLLLCVVFINVFNRLAQHVKWGEEGHGHGHGAPAPTQAPPPAASAPAPAASEPLAPEVVAAIAAALEIELRLYQGSDQRLTIRRIQPAAR
ncbi:MAG: Oxaloacetate decarboxylase, gamma chain [Acidobacteria bacterium ADurb.Bin340]|nr:MAG: Oxaloacetate decarboxylase, gamma chain [Acidobacteria bacterium ADurb.Bin340]